VGGWRVTHAIACCSILSRLTPTLFCFVSDLNLRRWRHPSPFVAIGSNTACVLMAKGSPCSPGE
jgi:hypothetical protein